MFGGLKGRSFSIFPLLFWGPGFEARFSSIFHHFGYPSVTSFVACVRFCERLFSSVFGDSQKRDTGAERVPESARGRPQGSPKVGVGGKGGTPLAVWEYCILALKVSVSPREYHNEHFSVFVHPP